MRPRRAFSLFEVIAVVLVLAVGAGVLVPRLARRESRAAEREVAAVRELLSAAALRATLTSQPVSLDFAEPRLSVQTPAPAGERESPWTARLTWRDDPLIPAAELGRVELVRATAAGIALTAPWRLEMSGAEGVPAVVLTLREAEGPREWVVALDAGATDAATFDEGEFKGMAGAVDLDASGMRDAPW